MRYLRRFKGYRLLLRVGGVLVAWTVGSGGLWFLLPQVAESLVKDLAVVGLLMSLPGLVAMFVDLPIGDLCDRIGGRKVLLTGLAGLALLGLNFTLVNSVWTLAAFLLLLGLLYQTVYIPAMAYVMNISPDAESSEYLGVEMGFVHSGYALGPVVAGVMLLAGSTMLEAGAIMYFLGSAAAFVIAYLWFLGDGRGERIVDGIRDLVVKDRVFLRELTDYGRLKSTGLVILLMTFLFSFYDGMVWVLEPLYYREFTSDALVGGIIMSAFVLPLIFLEAPGGWLADRFGRRKTLAAGLLAAGVFSIAFGMADDVYGLFAAAFLATTGLALAWPSMEGILTVKSDAGERGSVVGVWSTARDLGYVVGPFGGGVLAQFIGLDMTFAALGVVFIAVTAFTGFIRD